MSKRRGFYLKYFSKLSTNQSAFLPSRKRVQLKLIVNQIKTTIVAEDIYAIISGNIGIFIAITNWHTEDKFLSRRLLRKKPKTCSPSYSITPYTFANLLAIAQKSISLQ
ncbi:hypothetical protein TWF225_007844 [Orbilia oligospora]|uniref:Uncharacterized protein n=1 Tax=Orbilia oligospora TaxID=2813651 RepID=A0A7C8PH29_ORBOL|nr:hypothetical protein TWF751_008071 [Orbilia oligospora]KAF3178536.1 hypothetical protein TWF225_007844 [Orbilia oligospora]KAF3239269.1 hypothetical protein TWF217_001344 [Orbilia oligospora]KAF3260145.1 hypothetical protein TWF128_003618 [Orbilia oligospora]KAF3290232.1 hypothetical protein TWF132_007032 [Orbilia oligospora]